LRSCAAYFRPATKAVAGRTVWFLNFAEITRDFENGIRVLTQITAPFG
jgi:hypothetical protein